MALSKHSSSGVSYLEEMLECSVCLDTVKEPHTLQQCFHSFCKECIDKLIQKQDNPEPGVKCPVCRTFSSKEEMRNNFFIKDLAEMHKSHGKPQKQLCEQCPSDTVKQAEWKCLDCKMVLCQPCQIGHLKVKMLAGHRIIPLTEETEMVVDRLVFCESHTDQPITLYCIPCKTTICLKCKATKHDIHRSETVEDALERIIPVIQERTESIDKNSEEIDQAVTYIEEKIKEVEQSFECCEVEVNETAEERIREIRESQMKINEMLKLKKTEEIEKLKTIREKLQHKKKEGYNLKCLVRANIDRARHATLLTELVEGGLQDKLISLTEEQNKPKASLPKISVPKFQCQSTQWDQQKQYGLLGNITYIFLNVMSCIGFDASNQRGRYWNTSIKSYFEKPLEKTLEIQLPSWCSRIAIINNEIWAALYHGNINVYDKTSKFVNTIEIQCPTSIAQAYNGDILVTCHSGRGLNVIVDDKPQRIFEGTFSDVCCCNDKIYTLETAAKKAVIEFSLADKNGGKWQQTRLINLNGYIGHVHDTMYIHYTTDNKGSVIDIYISLFDQSIIHKYNDKGYVVNQYVKGKVNRPFICGVDDQTQLLVADMDNSTYKVLDTVTGEYYTAGIICCQYVYDAVLDDDGSLWTIQCKGDHYIIKYAH